MVNAVDTGGNRHQMNLKIWETYWNKEDKGDDLLSTGPITVPHTKLDELIKPPLIVSSFDFPS